MADLSDMENTLSFSTKEKSDLYYAVLKLSAKYRIVVYLYYYEGYSVKEISSLIDIRQSAIQNRLMRARKKLQEILSQDYHNITDKKDIKEQNTICKNKILENKHNIQGGMANE